MRASHRSTAHDIICARKMPMKKREDTSNNLTTPHLPVAIDHWIATFCLRVQPSLSRALSLNLYYAHRYGCCGCVCVRVDGAVSVAVRGVYLEAASSIRMLFVVTSHTPNPCTVNAPTVNPSASCGDPCCQDPYMPRGVNAAPLNSIDGRFQFCALVAWARGMKKHPNMRH
jgi:hypothetical protein